MHEPVRELFRQSAGAAPARRPNSLRRTTSIDVTWPEGHGRPGRFIGRARDALTPAEGGSPLEVASASFHARLTQDRLILELSSEPQREALAALVGSRAGGGLRKVLRQIVPEEFAGATPLYLLLDDLSGASLVSGWTWSLWDPEWVKNLAAAGSEANLSAAFPSREGICTGFASGSSALDPLTDRSGTATEDLRNPADAEGWHIFPDAQGPAFRRARRIDIWEDDVIRIEAAFQDSATSPAGGREVVHEYSMTLAADPATLAVLDIAAQPKVLPFVECPGAADNVRLMVGEPLSRLREAVLGNLRGTAGCTHLNDALRALADVPILIQHLRAKLPAE